MKVYIATITNVDSTEIIGVYSSEDLALGKIEKRMEDLYDENEDYGAHPEIIEVSIDDMDKTDYV